MIETGLGRIENPTERFIGWIHAREQIRRLRHDLAKPPWTMDPILAEWKFCNVRREDDRTTRWLRENWRARYRDDPDLWFAVTVARFINRVETLSSLYGPVPWNPERFLDVMAGVKAEQKVVYSNAYKTMTRHGAGFRDKSHYLEYLFTKLWEQREVVRPRPGDTLRATHILLGQFQGLGSFLAAQVIADLKHASPLDVASDYWTFAASGPGSRRGLNRVLGYPVRQTWREDEWWFKLQALSEVVYPRIRGTVGRICNQDLQNCLCEFDKYERVRLGEGRPKERYRYAG